MFDSWKKAIELDEVIANRKNRLLKKINSIKGKNGSSTVVYHADNEDLAMLVETIEEYFNSFVTKICNKRQVNEESSILNIIEEVPEALIEEFNINGFNNSVNIFNNDLCKLFKCDTDIKDSILDIVLYELINDYGKIRGPERALLFAKIMPENVAAGIAVKYASYSNIYDENFIRFLKEYLKLPSATEYIYWFPRYFDGYKKVKYCVEELHDVIDAIEFQTGNVVRSNERQKVKM